MNVKKLTDFLCYICPITWYGIGNIVSTVVFAKLRFVLCSYSYFQICKAIYEIAM